MKKQNGFVAAAAAALLSPAVYAADMPVTISGAVEVEASSSEDYAGAKESDIVLATVELAVDAAITDRVSAHVAFLYEEDATDFGLDEGTVSLKLSGTTTLIAGRTYVPFGNFESYMVSDPLTLELGETSETVLMFGMESGEVSSSLYTFNGDTDEAAATDNDEFSFGANLAYTTDNFWLGASYISNIADSDMIQAIDDPNAVTVDSAVPGVGAHFGMKSGSFAMLAEYVAASEAFTNGDLAGLVTNEETPSASNVELAFTLTNGATFAVGYQMTDEAAFLGLPETRTSAALSFDVMEGASVGIEYATSEDYDVADGGTGETANAVTIQLAVSF